MIRLLLDQGVRYTVAASMRHKGWDVVHTEECGLQRALDADILAAAGEQGRVVVTMDSDFSTLLALSGAAGPKVVHIRIPNLSRADLLELILRNLPQPEAHLRVGAVASVTARGIRIRALPMQT